MSWFWFIVLGALSGWLTQKLLKKESKGFLLNLGLGALGGFVGSWLLKTVGLVPPGGKIGYVFTSIIGALIVVWVADKLRS